MVDRYPVLLGDSQVGCAEVRLQGLFCEIHCRCNLHSGTEPKRVCIISKNARIKLGILVREDGEYVSCSRIPAARIKDRTIQFVIENYYACDARPTTDEINNLSEFLGKLDRAYLKRCDNVSIIAFKEDHVSTSV